MLSKLAKNFSVSLILLVNLCYKLLFLFYDVRALFYTMQDTTVETRLLLSKIPQLAFIILIACLVSFLISPFDVHLLYPDK